jgi:HK97 family phage prohead protease
MKEKRFAKIEIRSDNSKQLVLTGRPVILNQPTVIAEDYKEVIAPGALDGTDLTDVRLLYNHDLSTVPLARTPKTMTLTVDPAGLTFTATLPDTEYGRTVYEAVKRGDLSGMSFSFKVPEGGDSYDPATNTRTITKIEKIYECSIVPFPAYPQTSVEARDAIKAGRTRWKAKQHAKLLIHQIMKVRF